MAEVTLTITNVSLAVGEKIAAQQKITVEQLFASHIDGAMANKLRSEHVRIKGSDVADPTPMTEEQMKTAMDSDGNFFKADA